MSTILLSIIIELNNCMGGLVTLVPTTTQQKMEICLKIIGDKDD